MTQKDNLEQLTGTKLPEPTEPLIYREQLENSPFWLVQQNDEWNMIMGKWKFNKEPFKNKDEAINYIKEQQWNILLSMVIAVSTDILNNKYKNIYNDKDLEIHT